MVKKSNAVKKNTSESADSKSQTHMSKKEMNMQFFWVLGVMVLLLVVIISVYLFVQSMNTFTYQGLKFNLVKQGKLEFYHYSHLFMNKGKTYEYNLYLREDPRKNNVPVYANISLAIGSKVYISVNTSGSLESCGDTTLAVAGELSPFLVNHFFNVSGAVPDRELAKEKNVSYKTCENRLPKEEVILVQSGEKSQITQEGSECYTITVKDCEVISAVEKFEVESLIQARERAFDKSVSLY